MLEQFKQLHRGLDVAKVASELRMANLESLRRAALVVNDAFGDPDVERKTVISGETGGIIVPPEA